MTAIQEEDNNKFTGIRLPTNVTPTHYDICLKPDLNNFTFEGTVIINYEKTVECELREIVVHVNEIKINEGRIGDNNVLNKVTYSKISETATLEFNLPLSQSGTIVLKFTGILNDKLKGFYRTAFKIDNETVFGATTKLEPTEARRVLPCWDEPAHKATFSVTLCYNRWLKVGDKKIEMVGLSNSPILSQEGEDELIVKFKPTPKMSTYLLACIVGPFEYIEKTDGKRPIRVYTTLGKKEQGQFALDVACKSLRYYEHYFDIEYPLEKMDLIAIPDFGSGAMENWGLVTYRETCLLVDGLNTSTIRKQYVALVVAHELAHQWFGNLVTMEWWTHLWLNEGFASFMEFLCVDHIFPDYDIWSQFVTHSFCTALELDSLNSSHPIEVPINHQSEIGEIFDAISYNKGSSVIRMLYNYIGDDCFRKGMKDYLTKFAYKNAVTEDLWASLETASKKPVCKLMSCWTLQKGFPWLSLCSLSKQEDNKVKLTISQEKFTADGKVPTEDVKTLWCIPINTINGSNPKQPSEVCLFEDKLGDIIVENAGDNWLKLNPGSIGLYRTAYPDDMVQKLWPAILDKTLPPIDRLELQDDFFALCQAGKVSTVSYLKLLNSFKSETNYTVWNSINSCLGKLNILLLSTDYLHSFHNFGKELFSQIFEQLAWNPKDNENQSDSMTRSIVLNKLVSFGHQEVIEEAQLRYKRHLSGVEIIPADLRAAVYKAISIYGSYDLFDSLFKLYKKTELHEEKNRIGSALGLSISPDRLNKVIEFAFSNEVRSQDKIFLIVPIGMVNPQIAWEMFKERKEALNEMYENSHIMRRLVKGLTENFASEEKAQEIEKFFKENKFPGCERSIQQSLETIRLNESWLKRDSNAIKVFLSSLGESK